MRSLNTSLLKKKFRTFVILPSRDSLRLGCVFPGESMSLLLPVLLLSFIPLLWRLSSLNFRCLLEGISPYVVVALLCL